MGAQDEEQSNSDTDHEVESEEDDEEFSLIDRGFEAFKLVLQRSTGSGVLATYVAVLVVWSLIVAPLLAVVQFLLPFGLGVLEKKVANTGGMLMYLGPQLVPIIIMTVGLAAIAGLFRPMRRLLAEGADQEGGLGDVFRDSFRGFVTRFFVVFIIVFLVAGLPLVGLTALAAGSDPLYSPDTVGLETVAVGGGMWILICLSTLLYFSPAPYMTATRDRGVRGAFGASFNFVKRHRGHMFVAWLLFALPGFLLGASMGFVFLAPCMGACAAPLLNGVGLFLALAYWTSIYAVLEDEFEDGTSIEWS
jgi:hypothetical protein